MSSVVSVPKSFEGQQSSSRQEVLQSCKGNVFVMYTLLYELASKSLHESFLNSVKRGLRGQEYGSWQARVYVRAYSTLVVQSNEQSCMRVGDRDLTSQSYGEKFFGPQYNTNIYYSMAQEERCDRTRR